MIHCDGRRLSKRSGSASRWGTTISPLLACRPLACKSIQTLLLALLTLQCGQASASIVFAPRVPYEVGMGPYTASVGDLDGDGVPDLIVGTAVFATLSVFPGIGDGTFGGEQQFSAGSQPYAVAAGDLNEDGVLDVAVAGSGLYILLGRGDGTLGSPTYFAVGEMPVAIVLEDLNGDGHIDAVTTNNQSGTISVLMGDGSGRLGPKADYVTGVNPYAVAVGDVNHDDHPDLVVTNDVSRTVSVLLGPGDGTFNEKTDYSVSVGPVSVGLEDLNEDGNLDLVVVCAGGPISLLLGSGDGQFTRGTEVTAGLSPFSVALEDLDADGHLDMAVTNYVGNTVSLFSGDGSGSFGVRTEIATGDGPIKVIARDLNGDGRPDLVVIENFADLVSVYLNRSTAPADRPPVVTAPGSVDGAEGVALAVVISALDPEREAISSLAVESLPLGAVFSAAPDNQSGTLVWTPAFDQAGSYSVTFTASNALLGSATTRVTVANTNRSPEANAGGPYLGFEGVPISISGAGASDPDGDALTYDWDFGDGGTATGATPAHVYGLVGSYSISLTVTDPATLSGVDVTTATIQNAASANGFFLGGFNYVFPQILPTWIRMEPVHGSFSIDDLLLQSATLSYGGQSIPMRCKSSMVGDSNHNGQAEVRICFARQDLKTLFASLPNGTTTVTTTLTVDLGSGGRVSGDVSIKVIKFGWLDAGSLATVSPNPLNPQAKLSFVTTRPGEATVQIFDLHGRLVRNLMPRQYVMPGVHELTIDGWNEQGNPLSSGVYFYRVESPEDVSKGSFVVMK